MASQWFCKVLGQEIGPVGFGEMVEMIRAGTLKEDDPIRREGTAEWTRAGEVVGLFRAASKEPAQARPEAEPPSPPVAAAAKTKQSEPLAARPPQTDRGRLLLAGGFVAALLCLVVGLTAWRAKRRQTFPELYRGPRQAAPRDVVAPLAARRPPSRPGAVAREPVPEALPSEHADLKARYTQDFRQSFETQSIDLVLIGDSGPEKYFSVEQGGLRVAIPENCPARQVAAGARIRVKGDFQITARYAMQNLTPPTEGYGTGISLFVESVEGEQAGMGRKIRMREGHVFTGYRGRRQPDGSYEHPTHFHRTSSDVLSGWLRLTRAGEKIRYQIADSGGERFVEIDEEDFPRGDLVKVRLSADTGRSPTPLDAVWSCLDVEAEEIEKMYPAKKGP